MLIVRLCREMAACAGPLVRVRTHFSRQACPCGLVLLVWVAGGEKGPH